ncbi:MAG TPA: Cof-type HAD-IIB family hydrolase [Candidatus Luteococcus avicola]|nr:Cof-type HAD-IIB family hydrolase [Candidatus Luteococcus avicola]
MIKLVATDLDGTLLRHDKTVSAWTRSVLDAARESGIHVIPVTARQPLGLVQIAEQAGLVDWAIGCNGGLGYHLETGEVLFEHLLPPDAMADLAAAVASELPETRFASVRDRGDTFVAQDGYAAMTAPGDHGRDPQQMGRAKLIEVVADPALKLVLRHPWVHPRDLLRIVLQVGTGGLEATWSGADFVEVVAPGVTKATGLDELCRHLGVQQSEVAAFGDGLNDIEMLRWAGHSWAMEGSSDAVRDAAKGIAVSNMDDGVARQVMAFLRDPSAW